MKLTRRQLLAGMAMNATLLPSLAEAENREEHYEVTHPEIHVPGLDPAHDGLVIAQLSDIHVGEGTPDGRIISAIRAVNAALPDLVILTGDYVTFSREPLEHLPLVLQGLMAPTFAVLGNHDHLVDAKVVRRKLEGMGYTVLQNRHTQTQVRGVALSIVGVDDGVTHRDDVAASLAGVPSKGSRLVLAHAPRTLDKLPPDAGLPCFSGHTHGGQVQVPLITQALYRAAGQKYVRGSYVNRGNQVYVSRGLGFGSGGPLPRIGSDPEVALVTLKAA
jgi:uncharacterized protein